MIFEHMMCEGLSEFSSHTKKGCVVSSLVDHVRNFLLITITCSDEMRQTMHWVTTRRPTTSHKIIVFHRFLNDNRAMMMTWTISKFHSFPLLFFFCLPCTMCAPHQRHYAKSIGKLDNEFVHGYERAQSTKVVRLEWHGAIRLRIVPSIIEFA